MKRTSNALALGACVVLIVAVVASRSRAYDRYSVDDDATNCRACHGDFRDSNYVSLSDGQNWGNLHDLHRFDMLSGACDTCHGATFFPVLIEDSDGPDGFESISCVGCHGRNEDMGNDSISNGRGAGLRQHHTNAGIATCTQCHSDANPANYTPVGEDVLPSYYFTPDTLRPNKPTSPCNSNGEENYAGDLRGLDNDGDGVYDTADAECAQGCPGDAAGACCPEADVNGDGQVNGLDVAAISSSANFGLMAIDAADRCTDVNKDGQINGLDVAAASSSACFGRVPPNC